MKKEFIKRVELKKKSDFGLVERGLLSLKDRFLFPPFSVFDARQGDWQNRKRAWLSLGIQSEIGRGENLLRFSKTAQLKRRRYGQDYDQSSLNRVASQKRNLTWKGQTAEFDHYRVKEGTARHSTKSGTSIFDPVLCELMYGWFCPLKGLVLDPFAGGSVRGIVASKLGRKYNGIELSEQQVEANKMQGEEICKDLQPNWFVGDAKDINELVKERCDFLFSCPPYYNLEVYSDDERDISTCKTYDEFLEIYREIIKKSVGLLKNNCFACFVVSEVRSKEKQGHYYGFVPDTIAAFEDAGMVYYNEIILITSVGTLPIRVNRLFQASRKLGRTHQNALIFLKGDARKAVIKLKRERRKIQYGNK